MKKKFITKVVGVAIATLTIFTLCFTEVNKVKASAVNTYQDENYWFQGATEYTGINDINDLKGKTFQIPYQLLDFLQYGPFDFFINILARDYIGIEINEETHETIQCVDYLLYPYIIYEKFNEETMSKDYQLFSFYLEDSSNYSFFYYNNTSLNEHTSMQMNGTYASYLNNFAYIPIDNPTANEVPLCYYNIPGSETGLFATMFYANYSFKNEQDFLETLETNPKHLNYYFVFPNTDRYSLGGTEGLENICNYFMFIQPYNANIEDRILSRIEGYNLGYNAGITEGATSGIFSIFTGVISSVNDILQIEIFPNVKLGYFIWLPLTLGIVSLILMFWRKD